LTKVGGYRAFAQLVLRFTVKFVPRFSITRKNKLLYFNALPVGANVPSRRADFDGGGASIIMQVIKKKKEAVVGGEEEVQRSRFLRPDRDVYTYIRATRV
jgi:hypothetical protein